MSCFHFVRFIPRKAVLLFRQLRGYLSIERELWRKPRREEKKMSEVIIRHLVKRHFTKKNIQDQHLQQLLVHFLLSARKDKH